MKTTENKGRLTVEQILTLEQVLTPEQVETLSQSDNELIRIEIAKRHDLTPEQIERLAEDTSKQVREEIEKNPHAQLIRSIIENEIREFVENANYPTLYQNLCDELDLLNRPNTLTYLQDISEHGCVSGVASEFIYYDDTKRFYIENLEDIDDAIYELEEEMGCKADLSYPRYNSATWCVTEQFAYQLSEHLRESLRK